MNLPASGVSDPHLGWNLWTDVEQMLGYHFMANALEAATAAAVVAGVVGWFMVLRKQTFAGHTLSVVAFPGAAGAIWLGISALWGYFGFCALSALIIGMASVEGRRSLARESALIGVLQAFALACGFLFVILDKGFLNETETLLFGTFLGVTDRQVLILIAVAGACSLIILALGRRILFSSVDPDVAAARGVHPRLTGVLFLLTLGAAVAEISQITGALLVFALLVTPAAAAQQITSRPGIGVCTTVALAVITAWIGLTLSFYSSNFPTGFFVTSVGFTVYVMSVVIRRFADRKSRRAPLSPLLATVAAS